MQWRELVRGDWAILGCLLLESLGDFVADGCLLLLLSENYGASDTLAALTLGVVSLFASVLMIGAGRLLDQWPRRGPMGATAASRVVVALVLATLAGASAAPELGYLTRQAAFQTAFVLLASAYAAAKAVGSLAYTLAIKRAAIGRGPRVRPALYQLQYATVNVAALIASLATSAFRAAVARDVAWANVAALATGAVFSLATAVAAARLFVAQSADARFHIPPPPPAPKRKRRPPIVLSSSDEGEREEEEEEAAEAQPQHEWKAPLVSYLVLVLLFVGTRAAFEWQSTLLPKYMIRRFDASAVYPLFLAINPVLMIALAAGLPFTPLARAPVVAMLVAGTTLLAAAPLWHFLADVGAGEWSVTAYMLTFTLGEALGMPLLTEYAMQIVPAGREGLFTSVAQVPRIVMGVVLTSAGGWLLARHCPPAPLSVCVAEGGRMWLTVAAVSAITPVGLALRAALTRRWRGASTKEEAGYVIV